jgi:sugar-specific transcriptional regulator TrmB
MDDILEQLQRLGIPGYEAKAYLALLSAGQALNGYEVAKRSGVPRSTVYETLTKLVRRGAAYEVRAGDDQTQYVPLPADAFLSRLRRGFEDTVAQLESGLRGVTQPSEAHLIHHLQGAEAVLQRAQDVIASARDTVHVSAWPDHLEALAPTLRSAEERRVDTWIHAWGGAGIDVGTVYTNPLTQPDSPLNRTDWVRTRIGFRLFVVVADRRAIVTAGSSETDIWGVFTDDPAVVLLGLEAIVHYIVSDVLIREMGPEAFLKFWESNPKLMRLALGDSQVQGRATRRRQSARKRES